MPQNQIPQRRRALKAEPADQLALLELQELDAKADQRRHQRATLPLLGELRNRTAARRELDDRRRDVQIVVEDLTVEQEKVDADVGRSRRGAPATGTGWTAV